MRHLRWATLALFLWPALGLADDKDKKADKPQTPADQVKAVQAEYNTAMTDFMKEYRAAKTQEEQQKLFDSKYPKPGNFTGRMLEIAEKNPKDPAAVQALVWVLQMGRGTPEEGKAFNLVANYVDKKEVGDAATALIYSPSPEADKVLRAILDKNPDHQAQGLACFSLAQRFKNQADRPGRDTEKLTKEAEELFERVVTKYGDLKRGDQTFADAAKSALFEIRFLAIGKTAPEIEGEDIDGKKFKLSDYKGKVVVLDFWGHW